MSLLSLQSTPIRLNAYCCTSLIKIKTHNKVKLEGHIQHITNAIASINVLRRHYANSLLKEIALQFIEISFHYDNRSVQVLRCRYKPFEMYAS